VINEAEESEGSDLENNFKPEFQQQDGENKEEEKSDKGSETETDSEFDVKENENIMGELAGYEKPTSIMKVDMNNLVTNIGFKPSEFKKVLEWRGGPLENGKARPPIHAPEAPNEIKKSSGSRIAQDSVSGYSNDGSVNTKGETKKVKKQTHWKPDEDIKLKELFEKFGNQWVEIQKFFPDKTKEQIHNHIRHLKKSGKLELIGTKDYEEAKRKKGKTTIKINLLTCELLEKSNQK